MMYALWAMVGWCGTPWRRFPIPDPDPEPWWLVKILAIVGGILGGILVRRMVGGQDTDPAVIIATSIGAYAVGRVLSEVVSGVMGGARGARGVNVGP